MTESGTRAESEDKLRQQTRWGWFATGGAAALALTAALTSCHGGAEVRESGTKAASRRVRVVQVERSASGEIQAAGVVQARERAQLAARVPAAIVELPLRQGELARKGAVLVRLDDSASRAAVTAGQAALAAAESDRRRTEALLARGAATPREQEEAVSRAAAAQAALGLARENLSYAVLRAPFAGIVTARLAEVGDVVSPGRPIVELEGQTGLELKATVDAGAAERLKLGSDVSVRVDGVDQLLSARVRSLSPAGDPATHRFELRADLPPVPGLRSGLFARLLLVTPNGEVRLLVPDTAIFQRGGLTGLFVVSEGRARLRWVAVGETAGGKTEVRAGVDAGERVVVAPAGLEDNASVSEAS